MNPHEQPAADAGATRSDSVATAGLGPVPALIGSTRFIALLGVGAVLLIAMYLFALATGLAGMIVWQTSWDIVRGALDVASLKVEFLKIVTLLLEAVAFSIIGIGLYSLFIACSSGRCPFRQGCRWIR